MNETREQFGTFKTDYWRVNWDYGVPADVAQFEWHGAIAWQPEGAYKYLSECDPDDYMKIYLMIMSDLSKATEKKVAKKITSNISNHTQEIELFDMKFDYEYLKRNVYRMVENAVDTKKKVSVEVGSKAITNIVG